MPTTSPPFLDSLDLRDVTLVGPFDVGGKAPAARIKGAPLKVYPSAPHGITDTHKEQLGSDLLEFLKSSTPWKDVP